jgi:hypothetical protein
VISPGYYIVLSIGLMLAYALVSGFTATIDSSGFNTSLHPLYDLLGGTIRGGFGEPFLQKLFAEGPMVLALHAALLPVFLYLALSTIHRFTLERGVGAVELVVYGPADGTSYFLAAFIKDVLLTIVALALVVLFLALAAVATNLYVGPQLLRTLIVLIPVFMAWYAYAVLAAVLTDNTAASIGVFIAFGLLFILLLMGTFMIVEGYARNLATMASWALQWISPLFYWGLALKGGGAGSAATYLLGVVLLLALTAVLLWASHRIIRTRGVRA